MNICQGSPCLRSGAVTRDIATAMATAVGRQPCQGYFRFLQVFLAPLSKASRNALNYSRTKRPLWPPFLGGQHSANLATVRVGFLSWVGRDCLCPQARAFGEQNLTRASSKSEPFAKILCLNFPVVSAKYIQYELSPCCAGSEAVSPKLSNNNTDSAYGLPLSLCLCCAKHLLYRCTYFSQQPCEVSTVTVTILQITGPKFMSAHSCFVMHTCLGASLTYFLCLAKFLK